MRRRATLVAGLCLLAAGALSWRERTRPEPIPGDPSEFEIAVLAGGCYWCMEPVFEGQPGVVYVRAGYAGAGEARREAVEVWFDPSRIRFSDLLDVYWRNVDPLDGHGQFCDRGGEYTSAIYTRDERQLRGALDSKLAVEARLRARVETSIVESGLFDPAAGYDQDYARRHPVRYAVYRLNCGRDARLRQVWGSP